MSQDCNVNKSLLLGFFSGVVVGAAAALLYAPKSGKKLRRDLNNKVRDFKEDAEEFLNTAKETAREVVDEGITKAEHLVADAKSKADEFIKDANRIMSDAKEKVSDAIKTKK